MRFPPVASYVLFGYCFMMLYLCPVAAWAQGLVHRLGIKDGLPDAHVYGAITDRLGYLWLATPKGVVKYNGYTCTVLGIGEGLHTDDNWRLLEDRAGRIWLGNISHEIGYLKNDRYQCVARFDNSVYPGAMSRLGAGIAILSKGYYLSNPRCQYEYIVSDGQHTRTTGLPVSPSGRMLLNGSCDMILHQWRGYYSYLRIDTSGRPGTDAVPAPQQVFLTDFTILFHHFICNFGWDVPFFDVLKIGVKNPAVNRRYFLSSVSERFSFAYEIDGYCYIISDKRAYVYDSLFRLSASYSITELTGGDKTRDLRYCIYNYSRLWGDLLSTTDKGIYRRTQQRSVFHKKKLPALADCRFVGLACGRGYWWDQYRHQLYIVRQSTICGKYSWPGLNELQQVEPLSGDTLFLSCNDGNFLLQGGVLQSTSCFNPADSLLIKAGAVTAGQTVFLLYGGAVPSLVQASYSGSKTIGLVPAKMISYDRYHGGLWLYHNLGLSFYDIRTGRLREIPHIVLQHMGVRKVEAVVADPVYGNVFVKDRDRIWLLGEDGHSVQPVLTQYRHQDAQLQIHNGRLIVAGRLGVLSLPLRGRGSFGAPVVYENTKDFYYRTLTDLQVCGNHALLRTDKGFYELDMNLQEPVTDTSLVVARVADTVCNLKDGDSLLLPPGTSALHLDLVRPAGRGQAAFSYTWGMEDNLMQNAVNNEISLGHLKPYRCYRLYLQARDDVWAGRILTVLVQSQPQWWQSYYFLSAMILLALLLALFTVLLTRKVVLKKQLAKQQLLELSLDAIYARINPHFIFNTLSLALHHIKTGKTEEAGRYISRFSRLLRSYLKSARLRYTSIEEETRLLEDYIVLQQERFDSRFSYHISMTESVDKGLRIPTLLLQPFVENAIRHGLWNKEGKGGHLAITFSTEGDNLLITVADDGIGRERAATLNRDASSGTYGNELAGNLVRLFNKYEKAGLNIQYRDNVPEGTTVLITLKKRKDENV